MSVDELSKKPADGTRLGQSSADLISFCGATPVVQPSGANQGVMSATLTAIATDAALSLCVSALNATNVLLLQLRSDLVSLGLVKGSA